MGVFGRMNQRKDQLKQAEDAMPGAYANEYDQSIRDAAAALGAQNAAGVNTQTNEAYRGAAAKAAANAQESAQAAAQTAQGLAGGYGAQWAQSAADQAAAMDTDAAGTMAKARADALTQWQQELSDRKGWLSELLGQDRMQRSEYDGSVSNAADWRNYLYDRTQQARSEKNDLMNNVWSVVKNLGAAALEGYDAYKGYGQQKWEREFAEKQYNDSQSRTQLADQVAALQQATAYKQAGFDDAAAAVLEKYGLDSSLLDAWKGMSQVQKDQMEYLVTAAGLAGNGNDKASRSYLSLAGMDPDSVDSYGTIAGRKRLYNSSGSTRGTGGNTSSRRTSGGNSKNGSGFTKSNLMSMSKEYREMDEDDPLYGFYGKTLRDAGWLDRLTGTGNPGRENGTPFEQAMYKARQMANSGYSQSQIASELANDSSLSSDLISSIMNQIDYEWIGTK